MYYVYLLESKKDKSWYIGFTPRSPFTRIRVHNRGEVYYSKRRRPWKLVYFEAYTERSDALGREKFLKSGAGRSYLKKQLRNYLEK
jgi:putative endonuclease